MSSSTIRQARPSDQEVIGGLWESLLEEQSALDARMGVAEDARARWENDFPLWLDDETRRIFVAEPSDEVVGFVSARRWGPPPIYRDEGEVFLDELYVAPSARRQGLGTELVEAVQEWADTVEARRVRLRVLAANDAGRAFWRNQDAAPLTETLAIERPGPDASEKEHEGSSKIGF